MKRFSKKKKFSDFLPWKENCSRVKYLYGIIIPYLKKIFLKTKTTKSLESCAGLTIYNLLKAFKGTCNKVTFEVVRVWTPALGTGSRTIIFIKNKKQEKINEDNAELCWTDFSAISIVFDILGERTWKCYLNQKCKMGMARLTNQGWVSFILCFLDLDRETHLMYDSNICDSQSFFGTNAFQLMSINDCYLFT